MISMYQEPSCVAAGIAIDEFWPPPCPSAYTMRAVLPNVDRQRFNQSRPRPGNRSQRLHFAAGQRGILAHRARPGVRRNERPSRAHKDVVARNGESLPRLRRSPVLVALVQYEIGRTHPHHKFATSRRNR
jgi:hypothetical protein